MKTAHDGFVNGGIDYSGVYGGPPTRALFYEARRAFISGEKDIIEIPVFGDRVHQNGNFECMREDVNLKKSTFPLPLRDINDKEFKSGRRLRCPDSDRSEPEGTAKSPHFSKHEREGKGLSLATLFQSDSRDNGKLQRCSSFNGRLKGETARNSLPQVTSRDRHFLSFNSDFSCSRSLAVGIDKKEDDFDFEKPIVRVKFQKVKTKVLDSLSRATGTSVRHKSRNTTRLSSGMGCRFFDDVKYEDKTPVYEKNLCERKIRIFNSKEHDTLKAESNPHTTNKVSDSSISVDKRRRSPPMTVNNGASDDESDHLFFNVEELPDNGGSEAEETKVVEKVRSWSNGKEGNIRSLLSTLQYVLWSGSGWNPVRLVDIVEGNAVKKSYQKALLCLHPDKLQQKGALNSEKVTAEMVFDILKEAWSHFNY